MSMTQSEEFEVRDPEEETTELKQAPFMSWGVKLFLLAIFFGSLMQTTAKLVLEDIDEFVALQLRMSITAVLSALAIWGRGQNHNLLGEVGTRLLLFVRGVLSFVLLSASFFALQHMPLPDSASIGFLQPLCTIAIARVVLNEHMLPVQILCAFISLGGVLVIARPGQSEEFHDPKKPLAVIASLVVVVVGSVVQVILRKIKKTPAVISVANLAAVCAILSSVAIIARGSEDMRYPQTLKSWGLLGAMGLFGFIRQYLNAAALQHEEASTLSSWRYVSLVWAVLWEFVFWHDLPSVVTWIGTVIVLAPVLYSAHVRASPAYAAVPTAPPA